MPLALTRSARAGSRKGPARDRHSRRCMSVRASRGSPAARGAGRHAGHVGLPCRGRTARRPRQPRRSPLPGAPADGTSPEPDTDGGSDYPCRKWLTLDEPTRAAVIEKAIELAKAQGVTIRLPASGYVAALDRLIGRYQEEKNEKALDSPLGLAFHILAAMEGDWDDGESKVEHAKLWLGPKLFEAFREKYPAKYEHLVELDRAAGKTPP